MDELEEFVDFKLLNPYEKDREEVRDELLQKSLVYSTKNANIRKYRKKLKA